MKKYILLGLLCSIALFSSETIYAKSKKIKIKITNKSNKTINRVVIESTWGRKSKFKYINIKKGKTETKKIWDTRLKIKAVYVWIKSDRRGEYRIQYIPGKTFNKPINLKNLASHKDFDHIFINIGKSHIDIGVKIKNIKRIYVKKNIKKS